MEYWVKLEHSVAIWPSDKKFIFHSKLLVSVHIDKIFTRLDISYISMVQPDLVNG